MYVNQSRITEANYERIEIGMNYGQVQAILGGPPGVYTSGYYNPDNTSPEDGLIWTGNDGNSIHIAVRLDGPNGTVSRKRLIR
jgi:hypothetical protein